MILKEARPTIKWITLLLVLSFVGIYGFWYMRQFNRAIRFYNSSTDKPQIHKMFKDDWYLLISDWSQKMGYSVDFMLDNKSSVQHDKRNDLVLKVIEDEGTVAGFSAYYKKSAFTGHILFIVVDKAYRGKGYAKKLVADALKDLFDQGCVKVGLDTRSQNIAAQSLYKKLGFKLIEDDGKYVRMAFYKDQSLPSLQK